MVGHGRVRLGPRCHASLLCRKLPDFDFETNTDKRGLRLTHPTFATQGRWWYSTRKLTKDGVLNTTAAIYFHALKEDTTFPQLLDILSASEEFTTDAKLLKLRKSIGKAGIDEYARVTSLVREGPDGKEGWEGYATWPSGQKRARVLISAHLLRIPIKDTTLLKGAFN